MMGHAGYYQHGHFLGEFMKLDILFEDSDIIVVVKDRGVLSQQDKSNNINMERMIKSHIYLATKNPNPYLGIVHRLDRNVRGIMVFAKTEFAAGQLSKQIREREVEKVYLAVVNLRNNEKIDGSVLLRDYIIEDKKNNISHFTDDKNRRARLAELVLTPIEYLGEKALVKISLITGRHHQIRLQLTRPFKGIVGDTKYNEDFRGSRAWNELSLESVMLCFNHPRKGDKLCFKIETKGKEFVEFNAKARL